ncbi:MAG: hypothetical protein LBU19_09925 [Treponema sp.]|jgi:hypothetical protein|nr:hypothetical protein [Treponema sp.]
MKKYIMAIVVLLGINGAVSAELPQNGRWYFEVIGAHETLDIEIDGNDWYFLSGPEMRMKQTVTVDGSKKTITIPLFNELSEYFFYDEKGDFIDFYIGQSANINLFNALKSSMSELTGINSVSDEFVDSFLKETEKIFMRTPILRLRKYVE